VVILADHLSFLDPAMRKMSKWALSRGVSDVLKESVSYFVDFRVVLRFLNKSH